MTDATPKRKSFFGRRKGKSISKSRADFYGENLPRFAVPEGPLEIPPGPASFEIGYGSGEHLAGMAKENPGEFFLGAEAFLNGNAAMVKSLAEEGLCNVRIFPDDANLLLPRIPPGSFDRIFILYPDPWPKNRHEGRRMVSPERLGAFHRILRPGGTMLVASDHPAYVAWTLMAARESALFEWTAKSSPDFTRPPAGWVQTRYEAKALREGRAPIYLNFKKIG
ncbi:MAG: tRNA (guanine(46)-N(7))-methyltransferase TrmB [Rickettsiales bacterium]|jgi:tRNA (guanine-N7-)-methyltransferase|nr:tRNA (guanine(46)-N(7))-methyltransferase TrmB [Rickettsiales bacterium]